MTYLLVDDQETIRRSAIEPLSTGYQAGEATRSRGGACVSSSPRRRHAISAI